MTEPPLPPALRRSVLTKAAGVGVAVGTYGVSFGALGTTSGLSVVQTCALSVLAFTGASQFALVGVLGGGGSALAGTLTALLLGSRNALYGLRLAPTLQVRGSRRLVAAHLVIDETTAMTIAQDDAGASRLAFWATGLAVFSLWNLATALGAMGATALGDPKKLGLDAAVGAAFLGLLWPRLKGRSAWVTALMAAAVAMALTPVLTPGVPVLVAGIGTVTLMMRAGAGPDPGTGTGSASGSQG